MRTIWKFPLAITEHQWISMPEGAEPIVVAMQDGALCLWAIVRDDAPREQRAFRVVVTGGPAPWILKTQHIGTVIDDGFVWHIFAGAPA